MALFCCCKTRRKSFEQDEEEVEVDQLNNEPPDLDPDSDPDIKAIIDANSNLADNLCDILFYKKPGNVVFSPFGLGAVVVLAKLGARDLTAEEIGKTFGFPKENEQLIRGYSKILSMYTKGDGSTRPLLELTNKLFLQSSYKMRSEFVDTVNQLTCSEAEQLDFKNVPLAVMKINQSVENATNNKIINLVDKELLKTNLMKLLFVNGICFKGQWEYGFQGETKSDIFYLNNTDTVEVNMMEIVNKFPYQFHEELDSHVIILPYKGSLLSLILFVPTDIIIGLDRIVDGLKRMTTQTAIDKCQLISCKLLLPRFRVDSTVYLKEALRKLGVVKLFDETEANLSGLVIPLKNPSGSLSVSQIIQKSFILINEGGTGWSSYTPITDTENDGNVNLKYQIEVTADRPFLFQIFDHENSVIIFDGCIINPLGG